MLYAVVENLTKRPPTEEEARQDREREPRAAASATWAARSTARTTAAGRGSKMNAAKDNVSSQGAATRFNQIRIDPNNDQRILVNSDSLISSDDGGTTWKGLTWQTRQPVPQRVRRLPRRCGSIRRTRDRIDHGQRRRRARLLRRRARLPTTTRTCPAASSTRSAWTWRTRTTSTAACRITTRGRARATAGRARSARRTGSRSATSDGMYNQVDPTDSRWVYNTVPVGRALSRGPGGRAPARRSAEASGRPGAAALQLDAADPPVAAQQPDPLHGRAGAPALARPRRSLGGDQPRPDDQRRRRRSRRRAARCSTAPSRPSRSRR